MATGGAVLEINDTSGALSTYIPSSGAGLDPKYVYFSSEFVTYSVPEPASVTLLTMGLATLGVVGWARRRRTAVA